MKDNCDPGARRASSPINIFWVGFQIRIFSVHFVSHQRSGFWSSSITMNVESTDSSPSSGSPAQDSDVSAPQIWPKKRTQQASAENISFPIFHFPPENTEFQDYWSLSHHLEQSQLLIKAFSSRFRIPLLNSKY